MLGLLFALACSKTGGEPGRGGEREACRTDGTCAAGFICLSDRCVRPPQADCAVVGNHVASLVLGNYASVEERQPTIAKYQAECAKQHITKEQGACLLTTNDQWAAAQCVPALFPDVKLALDECGPALTKLQKMVKQAIGASGPASMIDVAMEVMRASCVEDHWPPVLKACIAAAPDGDFEMKSCEQHLTPELKAKMEARMAAAMQRVLDRQR